MLYKRVPYNIFRYLFGDRRQFGTKINPEDRDYILWLNKYLQFYQDNQKKGVGIFVNHCGFRIIKKIDFTDKVILEVGPGIIEHLKYSNTKPKKYIIADVNKDFLTMSEQKLRDYGISDVVAIKVNDILLPLENESVDYILSFHQLEHMYELERYILELKRLLKVHGCLVGAVPCEGGMVWGLGRLLTSRRYVKKYMEFNYDKIICWEHPNFVDKIKRELDNNFKCICSVKNPFPSLPFDLNLSWSFIYQK